jgi:very-short-patch-repair endonuclease
MTQQLTYPIVFIPAKLEQFSRYQNQIDSLTESKNKINTEKQISKFSLDLPIPPSFKKHYKARKIVKLIWLIWSFWLFGSVSILYLGVIFQSSIVAIAMMTISYCFLMLSFLYFLTKYYKKLEYIYNFFQSSLIKKIQTKREENWQNICKNRNVRLENNSSGINNHHLEKNIEQIKKLLENQPKPIGFERGNQGASEAFFFNNLRGYFQIVKQGAEFQVPWQGDNYIADFIVIHPSSALGIEIEIDEPYSLKTKQPVHCCDDPKERQRDKFFVERDWIVIRFSERQVVEAPLSCCKLISQIIYDLTGDESYLEKLKIKPNLNKHSTWSSKTAKELAVQNFRLSYLPKETEIINNQQIQPYKI